MSLKAFGEKNVQTSKHYGNLGRLYQSMGDLRKAEEMHKRAICMKEELMGKDDYEVALSIGHLASLDNYDLGEHEKAEELYLRSVGIGLKLFGPAYSGLEYDYRGLIKIYQDTQQFGKSYEWSDRLRQWRNLRDGAHREAQDEERRLVEEAGNGGATSNNNHNSNNVGARVARQAAVGIAADGAAITNAVFYLGAGAAKDVTPRPISLILSDLKVEG